MIHIIIDLSKYAFPLLIALYTLYSFSYLSRNSSEQKRFLGNFFIFLIQGLAYLVLYFQTENIAILTFYLLQVLFLQAVIILFQLIYPKINRLILSNMCFLLMIGFLILTRLSYDTAVKQFQIACVSLAFIFLVPVLIQKWKFLKKLEWLYAGIGICFLMLVMVLGSTSYGAKLAFTFGNITFQPSEFVKISFVFFVGIRLAKSTAFKDLFLTSIIAGIHILILVLSKDLGSALIFFVSFLVIVYVATKKTYYFIGGLLCASVASFLAYQLFDHVRVRVLAFTDPFSVINNEGYQITQSLFAIGTGGWFGMGLQQGIPYKIPVVEQDFIFSAIAEELGVTFAICLILLCFCCFLMFLNISLEISDTCYRYIALGLGTSYGFQIFLTIGGAIKFIPSTGVTLPLISDGGSSLLATILTFGLIQGIYLYKNDEEAEIERQKQEKKEKRKRKK